MNKRLLSKGNGCPSCLRRKVSPFYNLHTEFPEYAKEFDAEKNYPLTPLEVFPSSGKKLWWKCVKGHSWLNSPNARQRQSGCPVCLKRIASPEFNLQTEFPAVAAEWDVVKNSPLRPSKVLPKAGLKVWWLCHKGHSYSSKVTNRTANNQGCPVCAGRSVDSSNSLTARRPDLADEWVYEKNDKSPDAVTTGSQYRAWWRCTVDSAHVWQAQVSQRVRSNSGCPLCDRKTSRSEIRLYLELRTVFPDAVHRRRIGNQEADIYLPAIKIAVEYDGYYWHKDKIELDIKKGERFYSSHGVYLIRLREEPLRLLGEHDISVQQGSLKKSDVDRLLKAMLLSGLPASSAINYYVSAKEFFADQEYSAALKTQALPPKGRRLLDLAPAVAKEYDKEKNTLPLESVAAGSSQKRWWKCKNDGSHSWEATVNSRVRSGTGCPYCTNRLINNRNSLAALYPGIAAQLEIATSGYCAEELVPGSPKVVTWRCEKGHTWKAPVRRRVRDGSGCPLCSGRILSSEKSLASMFPEIAKEFDAILNKCSADEVASKVSTRYYWRCSKDLRHVWQTSVGNRTRLGRGCPYCAGQKVLVENSLAAVAPEIADEFARDLNKTALGNVAPYSHRKYFWRCNKGHVWEASSASRLAGSKCSTCRKLGLLRVDLVQENS